jgi:transcriptional regulator with XRE-family HTH domain
LSYQILQLIKIMQEQTIQIKVGKQIQKLRELKGISQQDLAAKCNFEKSNMSRLEAGRVNPTLSTLEKVANALDVPFIVLFSF